MIVNVSQIEGFAMKTCTLLPSFIRNVFFSRIIDITPKFMVEDYEKEFSYSAM
jgi:hypothetical protein